MVWISFIEPEDKELVVTKDEILKCLKSKQREFYEQYGVKFIGVFGSYAKGDANQNSDIDILYRIDEGKKLSIFQYLALHKKLEELFRKKVDLVRDETLKPHIKSAVLKDMFYVQER